MAFQQSIVFLILVEHKSEKFIRVIEILNLYVKILFSMKSKKFSILKIIGYSCCTDDLATSEGNITKYLVLSAFSSLNLRLC